MAYHQPVTQAEIAAIRGVGVRRNDPRIAAISAWVTGWW